MSVLQYPQYGYFIVADSASTELGSYTVTPSGDLQLAHLRCYHKKSGAYSYTIRLAIAATQGGPQLATSTTETFDNAATGQSTDDHLVDLTFTFPNYTLLAGETYFIRAITTGYTRNADVAYLAYWCNWGEPIGSPSNLGTRLALGALR